MPLITHPNEKIVVEIMDRTIDDTVVKRKAELVRMEYCPDELYVKLVLRISMYSSLADGSYGSRLHGEGFTYVHKNILADMSTIVNASTGEIIGTTDDLEIEGVDDEGGKFYGINYMKEFHFYKMISEIQPVIIDQMIINKIQWAAANGRI